MAVTSREPTAEVPTTLPGRARDLDATHNVTPPVRWWAAVGLAALALIAYVVIRWVTGPYFKAVPQGPTQVPPLMHLALIFWQTASIPAALGLLFWFVVRPWRRDRRVGADGVLLIGFTMMWFQDPLSSAVNHWFVYNSSMLNFGSWTNDVPWFGAFGKPGAMSSEPILFTPAAYVYAMFIPALTGCASMRFAKRRRPAISTGALVAWCYLSMCLYDIILEGLLWLPMGVFEYPGGHVSLFPNTYHKFPLQEMITVSSVFSAMACLRYFTDDQGRMWFERGIDKIRGSDRRKLATRGLAAIGITQCIMFLGYNVPNTLAGIKTAAWPASVQKRSYFTNGICGQGTNRFCGGPSVPTIRNGAAYIGADGKVVVPKGVTLPRNVPLSK